MQGFRTSVVAGALLTCLLGASHVVAAEKPQFSGFLGDYSKLQSKPGTGMIYNYTWVKPNTDFAAYNKFLIDAITIFPNSAAKFKGINANDAALLEKYFHNSMVKALTAGGYQVVEEPGPGVVRIRAAFTDLVPVDPILNTATTIIPQMRIVSGVISAVTGSNLFVGQVGIEAAFLDAQSNEVLAEDVAKEAGKKYIPFTDRKFDPTSTWGQVEQRMDYWAQWMVKRVQALQGKAAAQ
jgi:Protein of unknown function (DUF3313)